MTRPIHLRVLPRVEFDHRTLLRIAEATHTPIKLVGPQIETNYSPDFQKSYSARMSLLKEGALYLLAQMPEDYPGLTPKVRQLTTQYFQNLAIQFGKRFAQHKHRIEPHKDALYQFARLTVATFQTLLGVSERTATEWLSKAEEYVAIQKSRPDLMTLSSKEIRGKQYHILQRENPLPAFSPQIKEDLMSIKYLRQMPKWYNAMPIKEQQALFRLLKKSVKDNRSLDAILSTVLATFSRIPQSSLDIKEELMAIRYSNGMPEWYQAMAPLEKRMLRDILINKVTDEPSLDDAFANPLSRLRTLPYTPNSRRHEVVVMDEVTNEVVFKTNRYASSMVSSRNVKDQAQSIRTFHSYENLKQILMTSLPDAIDKQLLQNAQKIKGMKDGGEITLDIPYLVQTLISPRSTSVTRHEPDATLADDKLLGIEALSIFIREELSKRVWDKRLSFPDGTIKNVKVKVDVTPVSLNHPLNYANRIMYTAQDDLSCAGFIDTVNRLKDALPYKAKRDIALLLKEYTDLLEKGSLVQANAYDSHARELFLSSLEQLITTKLGGIGSGSCVSGKDRKAVELMHTDAMEIFHHFYGEWPTFDETKESDNRRAFVDIYAHLFVSGHHQKSAGLNATGADGIKTPWMYLPTDVKEAVAALYDEEIKARKTPLTDQDILASHNELKSITGLKAVMMKGGDLRGDDFTTHVDKRILEALSERAVLPETSTPDALSDNLGLIQHILSHDKFWSSQTVSLKKTSRLLTNLFFDSAPPLPSGIEKCAEVLKESGTLTHDTLAALCKAVMGRSMKKVFRGEETQALYRAVQELYFGQDRPAEIAFAGEALLALAKKIEPDQTDEHLLAEASRSRTFEGINPNFTPH